MSAAAPVIFALDASRSFLECMACHLCPALSQHEERGLEDGEHKSPPLVSVRGRDIYVPQLLSGTGKLEWFNEGERMKRLHAAALDK